MRGKTFAASAVLVLALPCSGSSIAGNVSQLRDPSVQAFVSVCSPARDQFAGKNISSDNAILVSFCFGYVFGAAEASADNRIDCAPSNVTVQQRILILLKWAEKNPELINMDRSLGLALAMAEAFPCQNKQEK
ncbi:MULTISPECIES: Rap1a/Tai family immunity protein [Stenotrophomonas]|uniref:Rap1a/Tai family immunity protein n=1 Tax=Stenotrophomonas TaxID=40323 RepID=UPI0012FDE2B8|nr:MULTISPECIES: Rap1a/Tai family immunity protein [Stenotrophomonas]HDS1146364.1 hypothetical protein [Stenotrophomonas maltophilia]HDS1159845.1 hypothetical protein [Stenotrophomonas maltophilia]